MSACLMCYVYMCFTTDGSVMSSNENEYFFIFMCWYACHFVLEPVVHKVFFA